MTSKTFVLWISVDEWGPAGDVVDSVLGARAVRVRSSATAVLERVLDALPDEFEPLTYTEVAEAIARRPAVPADPWEQLSLW